MRPTKKTTALALSAVIFAIAAFSAASASSKPRVLPRAPANFFGIAPQTSLSESDAEYMAAGGISTVRVLIPWFSVKPNRRGAYNWSEVDERVATAARAGLRVLPFIWGTPHWVANRPTTMPVYSRSERAAWSEFLTAAVERYGPGGEFWVEHRRTGPGPDYEPPLPNLPIRTWQIWNEANFFYFAKPVSPTKYGKLVTLASQTIKRADPGAKVILTGLFAKPTKGGSSGMPAAKFLEILYRTRGIKSRFDGIALHPYAIDTESLEEFVEDFHGVTVKNHDRVPLYITEMGWGSQNDFHKVAFEQGPQGQARELRDAYIYLLRNRNKLDLKQVYWFSWKDNRQIVNCNFCDSVGLFREGKGFKPKPAWKTFIRLTGGTPRP